MGFPLGEVNRLHPDMKGEMTRCCICGDFTRSIHWHHTVPLALGGADSLQIPLDGDCHTQLHSKASAMVAMLSGNKKAIGRFWDDPNAERRADTWLNILVGAMLNPPSTDNKMFSLGGLKVDAGLRYGLELLKRDLGVGSITVAVIYCIKFTLKAKGLKHEQNKSTGKRNTGLW